MYRLMWMVSHPMTWDPVPAALSGLTLFILLYCNGFMKKAFKLPGIEVLIATILCTVLATQFGYSGSVVGMPPVAPNQASSSSIDLQWMLSAWVRQWPWEMPWVELFDRLGGIPMAVGSAIVFASVDFLAILSVVDAAPASELLGQGVACVVSGMAGAAPIGGSLSRSKVAELTGCTSPLMGFISGVTTMVLAFPQIGGLMAPTPKCVLAAVVLAAVLPGVVRPKDVLKLRGSDAVVGWATAMASAMSDPTVGFAAGMAIYMVLAGVGRMFKRRKSE